MNRLFVVLAAAVALAAGLYLAIGLERASTAEPRLATVLPDTIPVPGFTLTDHRGETRTEALFDGDWHLLFFGFTHCPDVCPTTLATLTTATRTLAKAGGSAIPGIVLVSVDPERDTVDALADYVESFGDAPLGLTGADSELKALTEPLFIYYRKVPLGDEGDYTVDHSSVVLLINPAGEFHALFSGALNVDDLVHDLALITGAS